MLAPVGSEPENAGEGRAQDPMDQPDRPSPDRGAFERLIEEYADRVYNVALRITGNRADAEDSMQEAFASAYRAWSTFRGQSSPATWLYRIAVNEALMRRRRKSVAVAELDEAIAGVSEPEVSDEWVLARVRALPDELRLPLVLRDLEGLSNQEVAQVLGLSLAATKSRVHRARMRIRAELEEREASE
jgi:RNA polymerase sigma-70 factor, ECF subfamily